MLNLSQQLQRLIRMDRMIRQKATGNPEELAQRLGISRSMLYLLLQELKETFGCPLQYSRKERTFYYEQEGGLICRFEAKALPKETQRKTRGGNGLLGQWAKKFSLFYSVQEY